VAGDRAELHLHRCGIGGCGKKQFKATNALSAHGDVRIRVQGTTVSYAEHGGLRFYGSCVAFVRCVQWS
jgi:hypothetical protein